MKMASARIISNTEVMPGYNLLCARAPDIAEAAMPGQFAMVKCGDKLTLRRPLSINSVNDSNYLYIFYSLIGKGTLWLSQRQKGEEIDLLGPLGNGFSIKPDSKNLLLVAGGIGVAPLVFLAQRAVEQGKSVALLLGARTADDLYPVEHLPGQMQTVITTEDGSRGRKGMVSDVFLDYTDWADQVYACGPVAMYQTMASQMRKRRGRNAVQVSLEVRLGCGLGACYGCSVRTKSGMKRVCKDGPVFNIEDIIWQEVKL